MEKAYLLKLELLESKVGEQNEVTEQVEKYSWIQEHTPLLKEVDNQMIMTEQVRQLNVSSLNIGKDDSYYIYDNQRRIDLEHGDILCVSGNRYRVSLIGGNKERLSDLPSILTKVNSNTINSDLSAFLKPQEINKSPIEKYNSLKVERQNMVPSKSSFAVPQYITKQKNDEKRLQFISKSTSNHGLSQQEEDIQIGVSMRPLDNIQNIYNKKLTTENKAQVNNKKNNIKDKLKKYFFQEI